MFNIFKKKSTKKAAPSKTDLCYGFGPCENAEEIAAAIKDDEEIATAFKVLAFDLEYGKGRAIILNNAICKRDRIISRLKYEIAELKLTIRKFESVVTAPPAEPQ